MGVVALPVMAISAVLGTAATIVGGVETRNAQRHAERLNREKELEQQQFLAQQHAIEEEKARIEKARLLANINSKRTELTVKEKIFKERQKMEENEIAKKILSLRQRYEDATGAYELAQTMTGLSWSLDAKKERLTHDYMKDNAGLALLQSFMQAQHEGTLKAFNLEKQEVKSLEQLGKETHELNLRGIVNKAEAELSMSQFRIRQMREQMADYNRASVVNDIGTLFKAGYTFATPFLEDSLQKGFSWKFNYSGNDYYDLQKHLTFGDKAKTGLFGLNERFFG